MKIQQLLSGFTIAVTNEENQFLTRFPSGTRITALEPRDKWLAQNLVRKGLYSISNDSCTLLKSTDDKHS